MALAVALLACGGLGGARSPAAIDLEDPAAGLTSLGAYLAELRLQFHGTKDGDPLEWSQTLEIAVDSSLPARLLTVSTQGPADGQFTSGIVTGSIGDIAYTRAGEEAACNAALLSADTPRPDVPDLARLLRPVTDAPTTGTTKTDDGVEVVTYDLGGAAVGGVSTSPGAGETSGELWVASDGGYVVHYALTLSGGEDQFGDGISGEMRWDYNLTQTAQPLAVEAPEGCPPGMVETAIPDGAVDVVEAPGLQTYTTALSPPDVGDFYRQTLGAAGWTGDPNNLVADDFAYLAFTRENRRVTVQVYPGEPTSVFVTLDRAALEPQGGPPAAPTPGAADRSSVISESLNTTLGIGGAPALPSYHLTAEGVEVSWDQAAGRVVTTDYSFEADVAGTDVHLIQTSTPDAGQASNLEGYIVGGKEYEIVDEQARETMGPVTLAWALWPLQPAGALGLASTAAEARGMEEVEGRPVEVYDLDSADAPPETVQAIRAFTGMTAARGTVWIDSETGALMRADLDFEVEFLDSGGTVLGTGAGSLRMSVTRIGETTVTLP